MQKVSDVLHDEDLGSRFRLVPESEAAVQGRPSSGVCLPPRVCQVPWGSREAGAGCWAPAGSLWKGCSMCAGLTGDGVRILSKTSLPFAEKPLPGGTHTPRATRSSAL